MRLCEQSKYRENEQCIHEFVKTHQPKTIVELGYGSGALTVAMSYACKEYDGLIFSYDMISPNLAISRLTERNLYDLCTISQGNVYETYLINPISFDMILIDIDNTWELLFDVVINNEFINKQIKQGSKVIIEGGADLHPRINKTTLKHFHNTIGKEVFEFTHISGARTSLSILNLL
jgi:tRNA A58 N-methylase Trm61